MSDFRGLWFIRNVFVAVPVLAFFGAVTLGIGTAFIQAGISTGDQYLDFFIIGMWTIVMGMYIPGRIVNRIIRPKWYMISLEDITSLPNGKFCITCVCGKKWVPLTSGLRRTLPEGKIIAVANDRITNHYPPGPWTLFYCFTSGAQVRYTDLATEYAKRYAVLEAMDRR